VRYLDYANWSPSGRPYPRASEVLRLGYSGTIRYVTSPGLMQPPNPGNRKHITRAEYEEHTAAGLDVWLVYQGGTADADGGFEAGRRNALRALEGCTNDSPRQPDGPIGYTGPIFFCNDRPTLPSVSTWQAYLSGAASVLGVERVGAYGFANAMDAAQGFATWFWQAGSIKTLRDHVHIWQNNNVRVTVDGITCDVNEVQRGIERQDNDMTPDESAKLNAVFGAFYDTASTPYKITVFDSLKELRGLTDDEDKIIAAVRMGNGNLLTAVVAELAKLQDGEADAQAIAGHLGELLGKDLGDEVAEALTRRLAE